MTNGKHKKYLVGERKCSRRLHCGADMSYSYVANQQFQRVPHFSCLMRGHNLQIVLALYKER